MHGHVLQHISEFLFRFQVLGYKLCRYWFFMKSLRKIFLYVRPWTSLSAVVNLDLGNCSNIPLYSIGGSEPVTLTCFLTCVENILQGHCQSSTKFCLVALTHFSLCRWFFSFSSTYFPQLQFSVLLFFFQNIILEKEKKVYIYSSKSN